MDIDKCLTKYVSKINCTNYRIQATKFSFPTGALLVLNGYFPCDPRVENFDETEEIGTTNLLLAQRKGHK